MNSIKILKAFNNLENFDALLVAHNKLHDAIKSAIDMNREEVDCALIEYGFDLKKCMNDAYFPLGSGVKAVEERLINSFKFYFCTKYLGYDYNFHFNEDIEAEIDSELEYASANDDFINIFISDLNDNLKCYHREPSDNTFEMTTTLNFIFENITHVYENLDPLFYVFRKKEIESVEMFHDLVQKNIGSMRGNLPLDNYIDSLKKGINVSLHFIDIKAVNSQIERYSTFKIG